MTIEFPIIAINGQLGASISPLDRGFAYGDGVYETCRVSNGKVPLWPLHRERLTRSCQYLRIPCDLERLDSYCQQLLGSPEITQLPDAVLKINLTRGVAGRGYRLPDVSESTYCFTLFEGAPLKSALYHEGVSLRVCQYRLSANPVLAGLKHMNRLEQVLARSEWGGDYHDGLVLDTKDNVIETTSSNLFVVIGDELITPDLSQTGVEGVMRRLILEGLAPRLGVTASIQSLSLEDIHKAEEVFICNSLTGILPVRSIAFEQGVVTYHIGFVTRRLQENLEQTFVDPLHLEWLRRLELL